MIEIAAARLTCLDMRPTLLLAGCTLLLSACAPTMRPEPAAVAHPAPAATPLASLSHDDLLWLERVSFGLSEPLIDEYRRLGRSAFLEQQLSASDPELPPAIAAQI